MAETQVVVVGGGIFGLGLIAALIKSYSSLKDKAHVTLITDREEYVYLPANLRNAVTDISELYIRPYSKLFTKVPDFGTLKVAKVTNILDKGKTVVLESGESIKADILVLATGSNHSPPSDAIGVNRKEIFQFFADQRAKIKSASTIVILGGGAVGSELAAEIGDVYKDQKRIILVHSKDLPLSNIYLYSFREKVANILDKLGVTTIFNSTGVDNGDGTVTITHKPTAQHSEKSETISADIVFHALTPTPNTGFVAENFKNSKGQVIVKPTFQTLESDHVFALGDINDIVEVKQAAKSLSAIPIAAANVISVINGQAASKTYKPSLEAIGLLLGRRHAAGTIELPCFGKVNFPGWLILWLKGEDVLASKILKSIGIY
ncbi:hypothetical protein V1514DRAFT_278546 [Lipomyces japonicus]|uniref:uncharacterized protein n=1 Tax=Lipomyces japonicus TaxID=56871 RepID=UPI0034CD9095